MLATGEVCVALTYSGDVIQAAARAREAAQGVELGYVAPKSGAHLWFDLLAIPADAPNPEAAQAFIDFVLQPEMMAAITSQVRYPNAVPASRALVAPAVRDDPNVYPTDGGAGPRLRPRHADTRPGNAPAPGSGAASGRGAEVGGTDWPRATAADSDRDLGLGLAIGAAACAPINLGRGSGGRDPAALQGCDARPGCAEPRRGAGGVRRAARRQRVRQVHPAADRRGVRDGGGRPRAAAGARHRRAAAACAAGQHDVPELRAVPASERLRQRRLWPAARRGGAAGDRPAGRGSAGPGRAGGLRGAPAGAAFRRPAAARGAGPQPGEAPAAAAAGRAAGRAGCLPARTHRPRAARAAAGDRRRLRDGDA